jgi:putative drug exporter of the RND superfamily
VDSEDASLLIVFPTTGPSDPDTADLVHRLRDRAIPDLEADGGSFLVGGPTAAIVDYGSAIGSRLPWFVLVVVGIATVLLTAVFRSSSRSRLPCSICSASRLPSG